MEQGAPRRSVWREVAGRERVLLFLAVLTAELAVFFAAVTIPLDAATQREALEQANRTLGQAGSLGPQGLFTLIFTNNARIALIEMTPVLGGIFLIVSMFTTGEVIQAFATAQGQSGLVSALALFLFPFAIMEFAAYAFAFSSGFMAIFAMARGRLRREVRVLAAEVIVVVSVLAAAAAIETAFIFIWWTGVLLWVPVGAVGAMVVSRLRKGGPQEQPPVALEQAA